MIQGMCVNLAELLFHWSDVDMFFANTADLEDRFAICTAIYLAIWNVGKVIQSPCKSHGGLWGGGGGGCVSPLILNLFCTWTPGKVPLNRRLGGP
jgi:hypothetical protein